MIAKELWCYNMDIADLSKTSLLGNCPLKEVGDGYTFFGEATPPGGQQPHGVGLC